MNRLKLDIQRFADGEVIIKTKLDTKSFEEEIINTEKKLDEMIAQYNRLQQIASKGGKVNQKQMQDLATEIEKTTNKLVILREKQKKIDSVGFSNMKQSIESIGQSIQKTTKKVVKWGLAIFGIRSIYNFIRSSMSTISQYDDKMATDIEYIRYTLAMALKPIIEWIINGVYEILKGINYLSMAWFNYNLFQNASVNNFKKMNKSAKELQKTVSSFDEMNVLSDNSDSGNSFTAPSVDLSKSGLNMEGYEAPGWLKWIANHGEDIAKIAGLIIGSSVLGKLSGLAGISKLGSIIGASVIGISLIYTGLTGRDIIEDLINIKKEMPELTQNTKDSAKRQEEVKDKIEETNDALKEQAKQAGENTKEMLLYNNNLKDTITNSTKSVYNNKKNVGTLGLLEKGLMRVTGVYGDYNKQQENFKKGASVNKELLEDTLKQYQELYKQGLLNDTELKDYIDTMKLYGYNLDGTKLKDTQYMVVLKQLGFSEIEAEHIVKRTSTGYALLGEEMQKISSRSEELKNDNNKLADTTENLKNQIENEIIQIDEELKRTDLSKEETDKLIEKKENLKRTYDKLKDSTIDLNNSTDTEIEKFNNLKTAIINAYDEGLLTTDETVKAIQTLMSEMSDDTKKTFVEDLPKDIKSGLTWSNYISYFDQFKNQWNTMLESLKKEIEIQVTTSGVFGGGSGGGGFRAKGGIFYPSKLPKLAVGGIINQPGRGIPYHGAYIGERGAEAVVPLTDSQQMQLLGEAIGKYITVNANITNTMNGRVISRELQKIQSNNDFAYNR